MKKKTNRIGLLSLLISSLLIIGITFADTIISKNGSTFNVSDDIFDSISGSTGSYSFVTYNSNNTGLIIWGTGTKTGNYTLTFSGESSVSLTCYEQLFGYYINPAWGENRSFPLNETTLSNFQSSENAGGYDGLDIDGGLFTSCIGNGISYNAVFGSITYSYTNTSNNKTEGPYILSAGISTDSSNNIILDNTLVLTGSTPNMSAEGIIWDNQSGIGTVEAGDGDYSNPRMPIFGENMWNLEFLEPAYTENNGNIGINVASWYITGTTLKVKLHGITGYDWKLSGDITQWNNGTFTDSNFTESELNLTSGTGNKTIVYRGYQSGTQIFSKIYNIILTGGTNPENPGNPENPTPDTPSEPNFEIIITGPESSWSNSKTIIATLSGDYANMYYSIGTDPECTNATTSYTSGSPLTFGNENDNGKYVCFRASSGTITKYQMSNVIERIDTTSPQCQISQTPTDSTNGNVILSVNITESNPKLYSWTGFDNLVPTTGTWTMTANGSKTFYVQDKAGNRGTCNILVSNINQDPGHGSASDPILATNLISFGDNTVYSDWTNSDDNKIVDLVLYYGATGRYRFSTNNSTSGTSAEPNYYASILFTGSTRVQISEENNDKYICAYAVTGNFIQNICSSHKIKIDNTNPQLTLIWPNADESFDLGANVVLSWSGNDIPSGISQYNVNIRKPNGDNENSHLNSVETQKSYIVDQSGTRTRSVEACDLVANCTSTSRHFYVYNNGGPGDDNGGNNVINPDFYIISPHFSQVFNLGSDITFEWHAGSINSGYTRNINKIGGQIIYSGTTYGTYFVLSGGNFSDGAYSRSVKDIASDRTESVSLFYVSEAGNISDLKIDQFEFKEISGAKIDEYYTSNKITIGGLSDNTLVQAYLKDNKGALFINGRFAGTSGFVRNGDKIHIELKSSSEYEDTVYTSLIVGTGTNLVSGDFKITTENGIHGRDSSLLSPLQKLWGSIFVDNLVEMYQHDENKLATFLSTFMQILQDKSNYYDREITVAEQEGNEELVQESQLYKNAIDFLYTIVKYRYDNLEVEDRTVYIAPNGKQYLVEYDEHRMAYTSPDFARPKYFPTRELFTNHIDMNNPAVGKWGIVGNVITTHNGKIYTIYEKNGKWTSSNFKTAKYFDTKEDIINHILANNPASNWNHTIDTDFEEVKYTAPNGKVYKIFKTSNKGNNPNMYSSYNFVDAKYFTSLEATKKFIDQNNKK